MAQLSFVDIIRSIDPEAFPFAKGDAAEWVRSSFGILGTVSLEDCRDPEVLRDAAGGRLSAAYSQLESEGPRPLRDDEFWNITLFVSVAIDRHEALGDLGLARALAAIARDTRGSRKVILWRGESPLQHLAPIGGVGGEPIVADPIRDALVRTAETQEERAFVEILFKRRLTEEDVDTALSTLAREEQQP